MDKNMLVKPLSLCVVIAASACQPTPKGNQENDLSSSKPNIIYILADDMGYGDLSCYGQQEYQTPNIDKMAANGIRFTQHYAGSTVCAPSRSSLLTGEHTGHTPVRGNLEVKPEGQHPMPANTLTIAKLMKQAGYTTGAFGKWGLGFPGSEGDPNNQGFDEFYGYNCQRMAHRYYPPYLWHNQEKVQMAGNDWKSTVTYAQDEIQKATLEFIEKNKSNTFFAYVPIVLPHAELISPNDSIYQKFDDKFEETPYEGPADGDYGPNLNIWKYCSQPKPRATFASMNSRVDAYVGQIIEKLEELGIAENTIVMFSSDNGPHEEGGADPEFFNSNGNLKGFKRDLYEGGIRVPFIAYWPGKIKPGVSDHVSAFWDVMPTCAELAGIELDSATDGLSFLPELLGQNEKQQKHEFLYWEFHELGGRLAVRMGDWKGVIYDVKKQDKPFELYNLLVDEGEENNVAAEHPEVVAKMKEYMKTARTESETFAFEAQTLSGM
ncbi:arylsulfatase [Mangrovibacterium sp.]|uniref:arylsulfatase n=1 Tax=Mangrovibacterium sp. TaxID=1961364 RepID=UPI00356341B7